jgi:hypothetical protein
VNDLVLELKPPEARHYRSWRARMHAVARFHQPDEVHALCEKAHDVGARAVLAVVDPTIREALTAFQQWRDVPVWAVVPNMQAFIRDLTDLGMVGAARARFFKLRPSDMIRVGLRAVTQVGGVLKKDFATGVNLVADMELAGLRGLKVSRLFLHPQATEVALAGGVTAVFTNVLRQAERLGVDAGIVTHNPVRAAEVLGDDFRRFAVVISPCNSKGYKMFPSREACERLFRADPGRFLPSEITAGGAVAWAGGLAYVRALGLRGALVDPNQVEDAFRGHANASRAS